MTSSACLNNITISSENFFDTKYKSFVWSNKTTKPEVLDPELPVNEMADFEFRLEDPVTMLPAADELFSDGKLVPLQLSAIHTAAATSTSAGVRSPETSKLRTRNDLISRADTCLFSPKAPRCSSRWRELLGLKKQQHNNNDDNDKEEGKRNSTNNTHKSLRINFLNRSSKSSNSSTDSSLINIPLLIKDSDYESISVSSSRLSLSSSSSSGHEHDDLPRLSLDSDKPSSFSHSNGQNITNTNPPRIRLVKHRALSSENPTICTSTTRGGVSIDDSPRMNSSGKIVFHNLGRSSSSPSSFNGGGARYKHGGGGMERSYSANVRVTPVLNVPVCSLRVSSKSGVFGFPLFSSSSSQQKKDGGGGSNVSVGAENKRHYSSSKTRIG
uniref:Probable serine/threonine-protein kinase DDB_G0276461 n=1 Tax=Nicotiana sylvestris TaxID=4096 RepID=A0A1U7WBH9_NICSY|nr:PREDICTED: probable serine/threonine-protein kinase DDB_G0276461 [Nicotiana sylvestris]